MKILIVDSYYQSFLDQVYAASPGLDRQNYSVQKQALMDRSFGTADFYSSNLTALGHVAAEVIVNCVPLQRIWAREHGIRTGPVWPRFTSTARLPKALRLQEQQLAKILVAQVREFKPDVLHFQDPVGTSSEILNAIRPFTRLVTTQIASPVPRFEDFRRFDLVLTSFPHYVSRFRENGVRSEYFNLGFEPKLLGHVTKKQAHRVVFVGGISSSHSSRARFLEALAERMAFDWWGYGVNALRADSPLRPLFRGEAWGIEMYEIFHNSLIVLNHHIGEAEDNANNMRLYEATGMGALLVTDNKKNLSDLFQPGEEVVGYSDAEDCFRRVQHFLESETERTAVALAGQRRTLRDHTYRRRMEQFVDLVSPLLGKL